MVGACARMREDLLHGVDVCGGVFQHKTTETPRLCHVLIARGEEDIMMRGQDWPKRLVEEVRGQIKHKNKSLAWEGVMAGRKKESVTGIVKLFRFMTSLYPFSVRELRFCRRRRRRRVCERLGEDVFCMMSDKLRLFDY